LKTYWINSYNYCLYFNWMLNVIRKCPFPPHAILTRKTKRSGNCVDWICSTTCVWVLKIHRVKYLDPA